jgi:DNA-binding MarR family transcriptional regulator
MSRHRQGGFLIARIHRTAGRIFARMLRARGIEINPAQGRILFVLWQEGTMPIHELTKRVSLGKSTLTASLDRLEARGQIVRVRSREDRRSFFIELTPQNLALHRTYEDVSLEMTDLFYTGFTGAAIARFERDLQRILDNLAACESGSHPEDEGES